MTYAFLDTSIFMHYKVFEGMPWNNIIGDKDIIFVVPQKVVDEIDKHKDSTKTRLRKRAMQVNKYLLGYLDGNKPTSLNIVFCPNPSSEMTNRKDFDSSSADEYIVFSAHEYNSEGNKKVIISADSGMKLRASKVNLNVIIPDTTFRLSDEKTDEETRIQQLEKQLVSYQKTYAKPILSFSNGKTKLHYDKVTEPDFSKREKEIREELESVYPKQTPPQVDYADIFRFQTSSTNIEAYKKYNSILSEFYEKETQYKYTTEKEKFINDNMIPLSFEVTNTGNAKSGMLGLYLDFPRNIKIYSKNKRAQYPFKRIQPPILKSTMVFPSLLLALPQRVTSDDTISAWNLDKPIEIVNRFFFKLDPIIHNMPPEEVIKNEFYIYLGAEQEFEIKWELCDELSPNTEEGVLKISVS